MYVYWSDFSLVQSESKTWSSFNMRRLQSTIIASEHPASIKIISVPGLGT